MGIATPGSGTASAVPAPPPYSSGTLGGTTVESRSVTGTSKSLGYETVHEKNLKGFSLMIDYIWESLFLTVQPSEKVSRKNLTKEFKNFQTF